MFVPDVVCALDCGSNSTRLLISRDGQTLAREMAITRLSAGVDHDHRLREDAIVRTLDTLRLYRLIMEDLGVQRGLLVATSAVRDAANGDDFLRRAEEVVQVDARILSGVEEASFSFTGATADLATPWSLPPLICDIGGGSTELATQVGTKIEGFSMQLGCVRITERIFANVIATPEQIQQAQEMINAEIDRAFRAVPTFEDLVHKTQLLGLAGTVATLAQLDQGLETYQRDRVHGHVIAYESVLRWRDELLVMAPTDRLQLAGMVPGREDVLPAGLMILASVMDRFECAEVRASEADILDGVVASLTN